MTAGLVRLAIAGVCVAAAAAIFAAGGDDAFGLPLLLALVLVWA